MITIVIANIKISYKNNSSNNNHNSQSDIKITTRIMGAVNNKEISLQLIIRKNIIYQNKIKENKYLSDVFIGIVISFVKVGRN